VSTIYYFGGVGYAVGDGAHSTDAYTEAWQEII